MKYGLRNKERRTILIQQGGKEMKGRNARIASIVLAVLLVVLVLPGCAGAKIEEAEAQRDQALAEVSAKAEEVDRLKGEATVLKSDLATKDAQIAAADNQTDALKADLDEANSQVTILKREANTKDAEIAKLKLQVTDIGLVEALKAELAASKAELAAMPQDPTYDELMAFLAEDETEKLWPPPRGLHLAMAYELCRNAREAGIKGSLTWIYLKGMQTWYFAGFNTSDRGWVYIVALGIEVKLEVGKEYDKLNNFPNSSVDDMIEEIVIWDY